MKSNNSLLKLLSHRIILILSLIFITNSILISDVIKKESSIDTPLKLNTSKADAREKNITSRNNLSDDSLNITRILWRLKTPFIKNKMTEILKEIAYEKKLVNPYPVDFYVLNPNKRERGELGNKRYLKNKTVYMPIDKILDSLSTIIIKSVILRINKIDFDMAKFDIGLLIDPTYDNSYLNLSQFPDLKDDKKLRKLLLETVLKDDKKRSFEWIWGKSTDNDAYYSTKLTAFNGAFTIYLKYRTFIGRNSFRDKNGWFYKLANYEQKQPERIVVLTGTKNIKKNEPKKNDQEIIENKSKEYTENIDVEIIETKLEIPFIYETSIDTIKFNIFQYEKVVDKDKYYLDYEKEMPIYSIIDSLGNKIYDAVSVIKADGTKLKFKSNNIIENDNYNETIFVADSTTFSDISYEEKLKTLLAQAYNHPMKRRTIEFIYGKSKSGYSYYALVLTVFNGQITIFNNYRKSAKRDYYINKKGWFSNIPVIN